MRYKRKYRFYIFVFVIGLLLLYGLSKVLILGSGIVSSWLLVKSVPNVSSYVETVPPVEVLFNNEIGSDIFSQRIILEISKAQKSLEIAMYTFSSPRLREAVYAAARRGIRVVIVSDSSKRDQYKAFFSEAPETIVFREGGERKSGKTALMHHKFVIIDRGEDSQKLIFGSYNWTDLQEKYDPSFIMIIPTPEIISSFGREFERLIDNLSLLSGASKKYYVWDLELRSPKAVYEVWFSPGEKEESIKNKIYSMISGAQREIKIMIWDFTDRDLAVELIRRARSGIKVTIIADTWNFNNKNSVFAYLVAAKERYQLDNFELLTDENSNNKTLDKSTDFLDESFDPFLHHHALIVDGRQLLFGTNNWSGAGFYNNNESVIVSDDPILVEAFVKTFNCQYIKNTAQFIDTFSSVCSN